MPCEFQLCLSAPSQLIVLICDRLRRLVGGARQAEGEESMQYGIYVKWNTCCRVGKYIHQGESVLTALLGIYALDNQAISLMSKNMICSSRALFCSRYTGGTFSL